MLVVHVSFGMHLLGQSALIRSLEDVVCVTHAPLFNVYHYHDY